MDVRFYSKVAFDLQLKILFKFLKFSGLVHFNYNSSDQQFRETKLQFIVTRIVYSGIVMYSLLSIYNCSSDASSWMKDKDFRPLEAQDKFLYHAFGLFKWLGTLVFAVSYLLHGRLLAANINAMRNIFTKIEAANSDGSIFYLPNLKVPIALKFVTLIFNWYFEYFPTIQMELSSSVWRGVGEFYGFMFFDLTIMCYIYFQLVLSCFYLKMNEIVIRNGLQIDNRHDRIVRRLNGISFHIHKVRRELDTFLSTIFLFKFFALFRDIYWVYKMIWESFNIRKIGLEYVNPMVILLLLCPLMFSTSFDIYLTAKISDNLCDIESQYQSNMVVLLERSEIPDQNGIEVLLMQKHVKNLKAIVFGNMSIDQRFAMFVFFDIIVRNIIVCLQYAIANPFYLL